MMKTLVRAFSVLSIVTILLAQFGIKPAAADANFIVNSTADKVDANLEDPQCETDIGNECTLRLAGFASALREAIGAPLPPSDQARVDRMLAPAREALPDSVVTAEWEAGRSLGLEQAIELALSTT